MSKILLTTVIATALLTGALACESEGSPESGDTLTLADSGWVSDTAVADVTMDTRAAEDLRGDTTRPDAAPPDATTSDARADAAFDPDTLPAGVHGSAAPAPRPLPEFTQVVDSEGEPVGPAELLGSPTVMWFYPAASTSG